MYNEEACVAELVARVYAVFREHGYRAELILVDDGSRDDTVARTRALMPDYPGLRLIRLLANRGQTTAMGVGFKAARGRVVVSMDGDLQNDPVDIPRLLERIDGGCDVVCGWRKNRQDRLISRKIPSKVANWLIAQLTGIPIHDNGCFLKAYRREVIQRVNLYAEQHRFIPARSGMLGARIGEIVVTHHARIHGVSKYGISRVWKVFLDLFVIKMLTGFANRPLWWFSLLSLPFGGLGSALVMGAGWEALMGRPATVLLTSGLLFLLAAGQMWVVGMMGEMFVRKRRAGAPVPTVEWIQP